MPISRPLLAIALGMLLLPPPAGAQHHPCAWCPADARPVPVAERSFDAAYRLWPSGAWPIEAPGVYPADILASVVERQERRRPRWLRWGLIGAGAGAVTFAALGRMTIDTEPSPMVQDAALGAVAGFVLVGGSVALYDGICAPGSVSRRSGLC